MIRKLIATLVITLPLMHLAAPAHAAPTAAQCVNAAKTNPQGAMGDQCRAHGWTVNSVIAVDPWTYVRWHSKGLLQCVSEDGSVAGPLPCRWNFYENDGAKFWRDWGNHARYVAGLNLI